MTDWLVLFALLPSRAWDHRWVVGAIYWALLMVIILLRLRRSRQRQPDPEGHGSAAWSTRRDARREGCFKPGGMLLGIVTGHYCYSPPEQSVAVFGPPGEWKTAGVVIPTILTSTRSLLILDLSGDLIEQTFQHRSSVGPTFIWEPTSPTSGHLNPWDMIRWDPIDVVEDCQRLSSHVVRPMAQESSAGAEHYERVADDVLTITSLYLGLTHGHCHGEMLLDYFSTPGQSAQALLKRLESSPHRAVSRGASRLLKQGARKVEEQWAAATEWLTRWEDPKLAWNTHDTTIPWQDLQQSDRPMTIYLRLSPDDAHGRLNRQLRMMVDLMTYQLTNRLARDYRHGLDVIMEDVGELGTTPPIIPDMAAFKRKYGWRLMVIFQSPGQALEASGRSSKLLNSCGCWVIYRQNDPYSAEYLSKKLADRTVVEPVTRVTKSWGRRRSTSVGVQTHRRPLMTSGEIQSMNHEVIICVRHLRFEGTPIHVYTDRHFRRALGGSR